MKPLTAADALNRHFLDARCLMLDLAAILDRIDRGGDLDDTRLKSFTKALKVLQEGDPGRTEKIQHIFSIDYDPNWKRPKPRM